MDYPVYTRLAAFCQSCKDRYPEMIVRYNEGEVSRNRLTCGKCFSKTGPEVVDFMIKNHMMEIIEDWRGE